MNLENLLVSEVMNPDVITVSDEATLAEAIERTREHGISSLVVCDNSGQMVGMISEGDMLRAVQQEANAQQVLGSPVSRYMTHNVVACGLHKSLDYAMRLLDKNNARRLVVVDTQYGGRFASDRMMPIGILSQTDIIRALARVEEASGAGTRSEGEAATAGEAAA